MGSDCAAIGQRTLGGRINTGAGVDLALGIQALGLDDNRFGGGGLHQAQMTIGIQLHVAATGEHLAVELHAHAGFAADQLDCTGVHTAQRRRVDGQLRRGRRVSGTCRCLEGLGIDVVGAGDDCQVLRLDLGIDLGRTGDDLEAIDVVGVEPGAFYGDAALIDLVTADLAVFDHRFTGGQGRLWRVDKPAAVAGDAVGIGDDHMGRLPRHFGEAAQLAGAAAVHLVEDHTGGVTLEVRVAKDDPAQLRGLGTAGGVVKNQPLLADVVVLELVVRQPAAIGRSDIDDRYAIRRLAQAGAGCADHNPVRLGQQRLPKHRVGKHQRQPTFGQAQKGGTGFQGRRRLARKKGELANVHVFSRCPRGGKNLKKEIQSKIDRRFTLSDRPRSFQRVCKGHRGRDVLAACKQIDRVAGHAPVLLGVVAVAADYALVIAEVRTVLGEHCLQPREGHRPTPAQVVAPVAAAVAGQTLIFVTAYRRLPAQAHALWAEQHILTTLAGHQAAEAERLAPQFEGVQIAKRCGVFAIARISLARSRVVIGLGVEGANAVLHAQVDVEE